MSWSLLFLISFVLYAKGVDVYNNESSKLSNSAFCIDREKHGGFLQHHSFPLEPPEVHLPWIWDAIYNAEMEEVRLIAMSREACEFNRTRWQVAVAGSTSKTIKDLAYGLYSNILVGGDFVKDQISFRKVFLQSFYCDFFDDNGTIVATTTAPRFQGNNVHGRIGFAVIRCPIPLLPQSFARLRLRYTDENWQKLQVFTKEKHLIKFQSDSTNTFPFCTIIPTSTTYSNDRKGSKRGKRRGNKSPGQQRKQQKQQYNSNKRLLQTSAESTPSIPRYQYDLSICTATLVVDRNTLVEWLEYYQVLGKSLVHESLK